MVRPRHIISHTSLLPAQVGDNADAIIQKIEADNSKRVKEIMTKIANGTNLDMLPRTDTVFLWNFALGYNDKHHAAISCVAEDGTVVNDPKGNENTLNYPMKNGAQVYFNFSNGTMAAYRHQDDKPYNASDFDAKNQAGTIQVRIGRNPETLSPDLMYRLAHEHSRDINESLKTKYDPPCLGSSSSKKAVPAPH